MVGVGGKARHFWAGERLRMTYTNWDSRNYWGNIATESDGCTYSREWTTFRNPWKYLV
ncbi:hypothetical protein PILCRDRAFT_421391 [Piloderma croceum F 1598]|uniref:Uncharacterized protein n=1 Tax=Piloderma croceum (strain F 1598) TaxID=765440 RepID=A0A0C3FHU2_PILCF|nr:hypothetical protein PILCRDRAFT_421391 [Piloderma croceum F 1598]